MGQVVSKIKDELFSVTGASLFLQIAASTVRDHADSGLLPCIRNSANARQFKRTDLERFRRKHHNNNQHVRRSRCNGGARP